MKTRRVEERRRGMGAPFDEVRHDGCRGGAESHPLAGVAGGDEHPARAPGRADERQAVVRLDDLSRPLMAHWVRAESLDRILLQAGEALLGIDLLSNLVILAS